MAAQAVDSYLPLFGRDFLAATMGWTAAERGHYVVFLITQWEQGSIPNDAARLELISQGFADAWEKLQHKFPIDPADGMRRNPRLEQHRAKAQAIRKARSEAGAKGNRSRWQGDGTVANESQTDRNATDLRHAKTSHPSPYPSKSITEINTSSHAHENEQLNGLKFPCVGGGEWIPTAEMVRSWIETYPRLDVMEQLRKARQWCIDNVGKRKTRRGMRSFLGNWMNNAANPPRVKVGAPSTKVLATL